MKMGVSSRWLTAGAVVVALAAFALVVALSLPTGAPGTGTIATATAGASDQAARSAATPLPSRAALPEIPAGQAHDLDWHEIPAA
ncbi:MAG TPA: hypothetical protein VK943_16450, partial [Arenibaculum sp.]|nr:hypothetical protein [Arenibaculum sp.]